MQNQYRLNYINTVINAIDNGQYVDGEVINKAIEYLKDGIRVLDNKVERLVKKEKKELAAQHKELDVQLGNEVEVEMTK
jgi:hypothetical protein